MSKKRVNVIEVRRAGKEHAVVSIEGGVGHYAKSPCDQCPWRVDQTGKFPAQAFEHSACTAYDMSQRTFACHMAGRDAPLTCAGFLLRGADHNLSIRLKLLDGRIDMSKVNDGGHVLHESYREMAVANGVDLESEVLKECRP